VAEAEATFGTEEGEAEEVEEEVRVRLETNPRSD